MSDPFIAEIRMVAFNFPPRGWATCDGQLLSIASNTALFSLVGTTYGGDGRTTFGLPDLRGRVPLHPGTGPGLPPHPWGQKGGTAATTLTVAQMPSHSHTAGAPQLKATDSRGDSDTPGGNILAGDPREDQYASPGAGLTNMAAGAIDPPAIGSTGGNAVHDNMQPYLAIYFVIALQGLFPSRN